MLRPTACGGLLGEVWDTPQPRRPAGWQTLPTHTCAACLGAGLDVPLASSSQTEPGDGVWAVVGDRQVAVGRREWVAQRCAAAGPAPTAMTTSGSSGASGSGASGSSGSGDTEVWVGWAGRGLAGRLLLSDALRPDAARVVGALRARGLRVLLLSGDRQEAVQAMAAAAGIDAADTYAGVRPEGKAALVQRLRAEGRRVAMCGDGVNDAPALASADVGIAMGGGTAVAGDAAGVVLLGDRLGQVEEALGLGRATLAKIRQNLAWAGGCQGWVDGWAGTTGAAHHSALPCSPACRVAARPTPSALLVPRGPCPARPPLPTPHLPSPTPAVAYNFVGVPVAAGALLPAYGVALSPSLAAGAMALSSIAVVTNSISLRWSLNAADSSAAGSGAAAASGRSDIGGANQQLGASTGTAT